MPFSFRLFFRVAGVALSTALHAQTPKAPSPIDSCAVVGIKPEFFGRLIDREFFALVGSSQSVPGMFGALEIDKDQKATLSTSTQRGRGRVLTVTASGGVSDGVLAFINDKQASSTFSLGL